MRVKELAEIAGTTVRTVRHYHHVGLLDIPIADGRTREYEIEHLARLLRIRWLVGAGLSLPAVREVLARETAAEPLDGLADLRRTLSSIDEQINDLRSQRERIVSLIERAERDGSVTPLPSPISHMYDRLADRMPTARARMALEAERRIASILAVRGLLPPALDDLMESLTPEDDDTIVGLFAAFGELGTHIASDEEMDEHIALLVAFTERHEDQITEILNQISGRRAAAIALTARLVRLAFPSRAHVRVVERYVAELEKNPRLMSALNRNESGPAPG